MNERNNTHTTTDDLSFGFSENDGWLGGTGGFTNTSFSDMPVTTEYQPPQPSHEFAGGDNVNNNNRNDRPDDGGDHLYPSGRKKTKTKPSVPPQAKRLFWLWLAGSTLIFLIPFLLREFWVLLLYILQLCAGVTVYTISQPQRKHKNLLRYLAADGVIIAAVIIMRLIFSEVFQTLSDNVAMLVVVLPFPLLGFVLIVGEISIARQKKQKCTIAVEATCVELLSKRSHNSQTGSSTTVYCPVYEYYLNGNIYRSHDRTYSNMSVPELYDVYTLFIDPDDPENFYDPVRSRSTGIIVMIVGGGFFLMGVLAYVFTLMGVFCAL